MGGGTGHSLRAHIAPQTVQFRSGDLQLKAFLWMPNGPGPFPTVLFNHGSGGPDAAHTAGTPITQAAERLAPVFVKHGYAFFFPFRRGQGLSAAELLMQRGECQQRLQRVVVRWFRRILRGTIGDGRGALPSRPRGRTNTGERSCYIQVRFGAGRRHLETVHNVSYRSFGRVAIIWVLGHVL